MSIHEDAFQEAIRAALAAPTKTVILRAVWGRPDRVETIIRTFRLPDGFSPAVAAETADRFIRNEIRQVATEEGAAATATITVELHEA